MVHESLEKSLCFRLFHGGQDSSNGLVSSSQTVELLEGITFDPLAPNVAFTQCHKYLPFGMGRTNTHVIVGWFIVGFAT